MIINYCRETLTTEHSWSMYHNFIETSTTNLWCFFNVRSYDCQTLSLYMLTIKHLCVVWLQVIYYWAHDAVRIRLLGTCMNIVHSKLCELVKLFIVISHWNNVGIILIPDDLYTLIYTVTLGAMSFSVIK